MRSGVAWPPTARYNAEVAKGISPFRLHYGLPVCIAGGSWVDVLGAAEEPQVECYGFLSVPAPYFNQLYSLAQNGGGMS